MDDYEVFPIQYSSTYIQCICFSVLLLCLPTYLSTYYLSTHHLATCLSICSYLGYYTPWACPANGPEVLWVTGCDGRNWSQPQGLRPSTVPCSPPAIGIGSPSLWHPVVFLFSFTRSLSIENGAHGWSVPVADGTSVSPSVSG